jgi:hypothetical protein
VRNGRQTARFPSRQLLLGDVDLTGKCPIALFGRPTDAEGTHRLRVRVRRYFHKIALDVATEFVAEKNPLLHI